jgi:hypothetical protein
MIKDERIHALEAENAALKTERDNALSDLRQAQERSDTYEARVAELEKRLDEDADALRSLGAQVARLKHLPVPDPAIAKKEIPR